MNEKGRFTVYQALQTRTKWVAAAAVRGAPRVEGAFILVRPSSSVEHQVAHDLIPSTEAICAPV